MLTKVEVDEILDHCRKAMAGRSRVPVASKGIIIGMIREDLVKFNIRPKTKAELEALISRAELLHYIKFQEGKAKSNG